MTERGRHWQQVIEECRKSGLTQAEFCRRRGLNGVTFAWWKRQLRSTSTALPERPPRPAKASDGFIEVRVADASTEPPYEVMLASGRWIRVPSRFDPQTLSRLIAAVESC